MSTIVVFGGLLIDVAAALFFSSEKSRRLETILGLVGTLTIAFGVLGEWHFDSRATTDGNELQNISDQRVAQLNVESAKLQNQNLQLGQQLTQANQTLAETELKLGLVRERESWRHLDLRKFVASLQNKPKPLGVTILFLREDSETWSLADQIFEALHEAQWPVAFPEPIPPSQSRWFSHLPLVSSVGANAYGGISIITGDEVKVPFWEDKSPGGALIQAFLASLPGQVSGGKAYSEQPVPAGCIRIVVGPRMDPAMQPWPLPKQ